MYTKFQYLILTAEGPVPVTTDEEAEGGARQEAGAGRRACRAGWWWGWGWCGGDVGGPGHGGRCTGNCRSRSTEQRDGETWSTSYERDWNFEGI